MSKKLLLPVIPFLFLIIIELCIRTAVSFFDLQLDIVVVHPNLGQRELKKQIYVNDRYLLWRMKPNLRGQFVSPAKVPEGSEPPVFQVITNSTGFAGEEFTPGKQKDTFRIVCMGNSSTFGWGTSPDSCYSILLEEILARKLGKRVEVINAGVPGYSSLQGLTLLKREILRLSPDVVSLSYGANDCHMTSRSDSEIMKERAGTVGAVQEILSKLSIYRLLRYGIVSLKVKRELDEDSMPSRRRVNPREFRATTREMIKTARRAGSEVFLLEILPSNRQWDPYRKILSELSVDLSVPLLNTDDLFEDFLKNLGSLEENEQAYIEATREKYNNSFIALHPDVFLRLDLVHPTSLGHLLIARALSDTIADHLSERAE